MLVISKDTIDDLGHYIPSAHGTTLKHHFGFKSKLLVLPQVLLKVFELALQHGSGGGYKGSLID